MGEEENGILTNATSMPFDKYSRTTIYYRTDGYCHICHKKLSLENYGVLSARGAWEVEHSRPRAKGGTNHGNNLKPACVKCNRDKSDYTTRTARKWNGTSKAPFSKATKTKMREENANTFAVIGGLVGIIGGPLGVVAGGFIGHQIGRDIRPPKT